MRAVHCGHLVEHLLSEFGDKVKSKCHMRLFECSGPSGSGGGGKPHSSPPSPLPPDNEIKKVRTVAGGGEGEGGVGRVVCHNLHAVAMATRVYTESRRLFKTFLRQNNITFRKNITYVGSVCFFQIHFLKKICLSSCRPLRSKSILRKDI